jgi:hypothetical protein
MARLRDAVEVLVQERTRKPLMTYLIGSRTEGKGLRTIALELSDLSGLTISHETVRTWILEG